MRIAVLASGRGTNFAALARAAKAGKIQADVVLLITDNPQAGAIERARILGVPHLVVNPKEFPDKAAYEESILHYLRQFSVDFVVLAGYMRIVGPTLLTEYEGRMINLHPSLLPAFKGKDAIGQALAYGVTITGVTVHYIDEGIDTGPVIDQVPVPVEKGESRESLEEKIHAVEHRLLIQVVDRLSKDFRAQRKGRGQCGGH